jgi:radical SAM superfamily enzyme YgiQ (UPF0313 family)
LKICLVFSPFSSLSYVPLGISYLKSFIEKNIPSARVKNFDLSNNFYHNLNKKKFLNSLLSLCHACPIKNRPECRKILKKNEFAYWVKTAYVAKDYIFDSKSKESYSSPQSHQLRKFYNLFYSHIKFCIDGIMRYCLEHMREENIAILEDKLLKGDVDRIISGRPEVVGFSVFSETQLYYSLILAKILKSRIAPQIIFGGACIAHLDKKTILRIFDFIDFIIYKEGELGIVGLLKNLKKKNFSQVPGLVYRKEGRIIENKDLPVRNLDDIPFPDFNDYNLKKYFTGQPLVSTLFSRACFWGACTFCAQLKTYSRPYRRRSIANLMSELQRYQQKGFRQIYFADEVISAQDLDLISRALLKKKISINYQAMARPASDFSREIFKRMYRAGCRSILWGIESFNQRILDLMNKGTRADKIEGILKLSHKAGIYNIASMIQGFPTQAEEELLKDREILRKNAKYLYSIRMHDFWLEEDTDIFRNPKKFGLKNLQRKYLLKNKRYKLFFPSIYIMYGDSKDKGRQGK